MIQRLKDALHQRGSLRILGTAVIDQVLLSGANFLVGVILVRYAGDADYGYFVLAQSAVLLLTGAQAAWIGGPLAVLAPKKSDAERRYMVGVVEQSQTRILRWLTVIAMAVVACGYVLGLLDATAAMAAAATVAACWAALLREYRRSVLLLYSRPQLVLLADVLYVVGLTGTAGLAALGAEPKMVLAILSLAVGGFCGGQMADRFLLRDPGWQSKLGDDPVVNAQAATDVWRQLRRLGNWSMVGSVIYWTFGQGFNSVTAIQLGVVAVATLNAARLLIQPTFVMTMGVKQALLPMASRWLHDLGLSALIKRLSAVVAVLTVLNLLYLALIWNVLDWLTGDFLRKTIPDRNTLVLLWVVYSMVNMVRDMYQSALLALERFRILTGITAITAVVALGVMWPATAAYGVRGAIYGLLAGEVTYLLIVFGLIGQSLRQHRTTQAQNPG